MLNRDMLPGIGSKVNCYDLVTKLGRIYGSVPGWMPLLNDYALPPLFLVLELTYRCNLACPYCYLRSAEHRSSSMQELSPAEIEHIIGQTPPWALILLSGGEIIVRDDLDQILQKIVRKRRCHIFTNGTLITARVVQQWIDLGLASVAVSVDGPEKIHDATRGPGTFSSAMSAIQMIVAARRGQGRAFPLVNLKATITAGSAGHMAEIVHLAEETGADYCTLQVLNRTTRLSGSADPINSRLLCQSAQPNRIWLHFALGRDVRLPLR
jgi:MoaA/NifB/PqqE/SkfB family radical SAM enzyme